MPRRAIATYPALVDNTSAPKMPAIGRMCRHPQASSSQTAPRAKTTDGRRMAASFLSPNTCIAAASSQK
jgi:hypothetical protein